jgi:HPt (histidine-containing phosphotransfer) domain-containing protein
MNTVTNSPSMLLQTPTPAELPAVTDANEPLVRMENIVEYIGEDPEVQRQVFHLCLDLVATNLPKFCQAMESGDIATLQCIAHQARGSLGMLGLPMLQELGLEVEYNHENLGTEPWRLRCEALYRLLQHLQQELEVRLAA